MENKAEKSRYFQKTFLVANIKVKIALKIFFLKPNNTNMSFGKEILM